MFGLDTSARSVLTSSHFSISVFGYIRSVEQVCALTSAPVRNSESAHCLDDRPFSVAAVANARRGAGASE